jgi:hypothetical protein
MGPKIGKNTQEVCALNKYANTKVSAWLSRSMNMTRESELKQNMAFPTAIWTLHTWMHDKISPQVPIMSDNGHGNRFDLK